MSLNINDINALTPEEVAALNKKLTRALAKQLLVRTCVTVTAVIAVSYVIGKIDAAIPVAAAEAATEAA